MERWIGKVAVVTGVSSAIVATIAEKLVKEGLKVVGLAREVHLIEEKSKMLSDSKGTLYAVKTDVTKEEDIVNGFKWTERNVGPVSILINCAGFFKDPSVICDKTEKWMHFIDINVLGLCHATREAVKRMQTNKISGHIIHIDSYLEHIIPQSSGLNIYAANFSATAITKTFRQEILTAKCNIKISSISPGMVATEMTVVNKDLSEERLNLLKQMASLKNEDIADAAIYILSKPPHVQVHELMIKPMGEAV